MKLNLPTMLRAAADFIEQHGQFNRNAAALSTIADGVGMAPAAPAALDFSSCGSAHDAGQLWLKNGMPKMECSPEEMYWRGQPAYLRPAYWRDDVI